MWLLVRDLSERFFKMVTDPVWSHLYHKRVRFFSLKYYSVRCFIDRNVSKKFCHGGFYFKKRYFSFFADEASIMQTFDGIHELVCDIITIILNFIWRPFWNVFVANLIHTSSMSCLRWCNTKNYDLSRFEKFKGCRLESLLNRSVIFFSLRNI